MQTPLPRSLEEATRSLIENLLASEAFVHYHRAQSRMDDDPDAHDLLRQLSQAQARLRQGQTHASVTETEVDALRDLQQKVRNSQVILDYAESQQEAVRFLREIDAEISSLLGVNFASLANYSTC
jgi:cell fate (sporulation/competence/biofilm development) regulator YlbF (YheA/YmcA/DUF963 family)